MGLQPLRTVVQHTDEETGDTIEVISYAGVIDWFRILLPDIVVFVVALVCYLTLRKIRQKNHSGSQETQLIHSSSSAGGCQTETFLASSNESQTESELLYFERLNFGLFIASLVFLGFAGIASPSLLSLPYLLLFLSLMTFYSFHMELEPMRLIYKVWGYNVDFTRILASNSKKNSGTREICIHFSYVYAFQPIPPAIWYLYTFTNFKYSIKNG